MAGAEGMQPNVTGGSPGTARQGSEQTGSSGNVRDKAEQMGAAAGRAVGDALTRAQETAAGLAQRAQETASNLTQRARDMASAAGERAHGAVSSVGERMSNLAGSIRESAPEGVARTAASAVADRLEASGHYLQEQQFADMAEDLAAIVRSHPLQSLMIGFGVGCLVGMVLKRR